MKRAEKVYEPDEDTTHYVGPDGMDQVTLCGKTDWLGESKGMPTTAPVTCWGCMQYVKFIKGHVFERAAMASPVGAGEKGGA